MRLFVIVTGMAHALALLAAGLGGAWVWLSLFYMTGLVVLIDRIVAHGARNADPEAEFPAATPLLVLLGLSHFALLGLAIWAVGGPSGLSAAQRLAMAVAAGLVFGQISHPAAHELIHRQARGLRLVGKWVYTSLLVGHHASAHLLVHHVHVASRADPNSAPRGQSFYRFAARAWRGAFLAGLAAETRRRAGRGLPAWRHPFALYLGGGALTLGMAFALAGAGGVAALLAMAIHAQLQILLSDYVQHYGLRRRELADGRPEPVGPQHSWNAPQMFSSALMLNAPRHSDHHVTPSRAYPALQLDPRTMPCLPRSLPVMAALALLPRLWFRLMDPCCEAWERAGHGAGREPGSAPPRGDPQTAPETAQ